MRLRALIQPGQRSEDIEIKVGKPVLIGRDPRCRIVIDEQEVSRRHCRLVLVEGEQLQIEDLGSREGTYINGFCIDRPTPLPFGKRVAVGTHKLRFERVLADAPRPSQELRRCTGCRQRTPKKELRAVETAVGKEVLCAACRAAVSHVVDAPGRPRESVQRGPDRERARNTQPSAETRRRKPDPRRSRPAAAAGEEARSSRPPDAARPRGVSRDSRAARPVERARGTQDPRSSRPAPPPGASRAAEARNPRPRPEASDRAPRQRPERAPAPRRPQDAPRRAGPKEAAPARARTPPIPTSPAERTKPERTSGKLAPNMPGLPPPATGAPAPERKAAPSLFAQYQVVRKVCEEPYPQVLARSKETNQEALLSRFPVRDAERFLADVQAIQAMRHAVLPKVFGCTAGKGFAYVAQEYIEGETLHELVQRAGPFPESEVRSIIGQVGEALASMHSWGLYHGSLRPACIVRTEDGRHRISDFGLDKHRVEAPSHEADVASDIFCLSLTLAYLVSGLFLAEDTAPLELRDQPPELILRILVEHGDVSDPLMELLGKALAPDPGAGFRSLDAMLRELSQVEFAVVQAAMDQQQSGEFTAPYHLRKIVRQLERDRVTGELRIEGSFGLKTLDGSLWLKKGMLVWAELGPRSGLEVAQETLRLKAGEWLFTPSCTPPRDQSFRPRQASEFIEKR